jgi:alpha-glucuronidase
VFGRAKAAIMNDSSPAIRIAEGENGYRLWLRYERIADEAKRLEYLSAIKHIVAPLSSDSMAAAVMELQVGLRGLFGQPVTITQQPGPDGALCLGTPENSEWVRAAGLQTRLEALGAEGYLIARSQQPHRPSLLVAANSDIGVLYGTFALLRSIQTQARVTDLDQMSTPRIRRRLLNHWDNLDGTIERGYAGCSLWDWHKLPDYLSPRYLDYARANASIGINGAVLNNVNSHSLVLTTPYLQKAAALANVFRPYGIRVYLSARFSAPIEIGGLPTADPLDPGVIAWWRDKAQEIYELIPDFGGFLVKANSEGQPGPNDFKRNHADGANVLADALRPHGGVVIWRAFVYDAAIAEERHRQANLEFAPLDGAFRENAFIQVKNGPIDFQPREPFHPLFGAMPKTKLVLEFQITQEYLGNATHLVYLAPLFKETILADTFARGPGSTVAKIVAGSIDGHSDSGIAGVSNVGSELNWCGHPFAAANWYAFGRLAWDHTLSAESVAEEWVRMTFTNDAKFIGPALKIMLDSREAVVDYMTPLGLHHIMAWDHHHGPGPWVSQGRVDWTSPYYHQADALGLGANRGPSGSNAIAQYAPEVQAIYGDPATCPDELLLWFHHVAWQKPLRSGRTLWQELCWRYDRGVKTVREMQNTWQSVSGLIDEKRASHVRALLGIQEKEACWWRDACVQYFQTFSRLPLPNGYELPAHSLDYYRGLAQYYVPGIPERRFERK